MKLGMNFFLWTTNVTEDLFPVFPKLKEVWYEGVEVPISRASKPIVAERRKVFDDLGLACTTMFNLMLESFATDVPPLSALAHVWPDCFRPPRNRSTRRATISSAASGTASRPTRRAR